MGGECHEGSGGGHSKEAQSVVSPRAWVEDRLVSVRASPRGQSYVPEHNPTWEPLSDGLEIREVNHKLVYGAFHEDVQRFALVLLRQFVLGPPQQSHHGTGHWIGPEFARFGAQGAVLAVVL